MEEEERRGRNWVGRVRGRNKGGGREQGWREGGEGERGRGRGEGRVRGARILMMRNTNYFIVIWFS